MNLEVNKNLCIGCGLCASQFPEVMEIDESEGCAKVKEEPEAYYAEKDIISICPMGAIEKENE